MKIVFSLPGYHRISNGLNVMHQLARRFQQLGAQVRIIPWWHDYMGKVYEQPKAYKDLYTAHFDISDAIGFFPDAIPADIAWRLKTSVKRSAWWLCNVPGLLGHQPYPFGGDDLLFAYSTLVSPHLPQLYYHADLPDLPSLEYVLREKKNVDLVAVYTGKGKVRPIPRAVASQLPAESKIVYISRFFPETKELLYTLLTRSKFLISFDPISSLNYEATLLGTPVFLVNHLRPEIDFRHHFNVPASGMCTSAEEMLGLARVGLDAEKTRTLHQEALAGNDKRVEKAYRLLERWMAMNGDEVLEPMQATIATLYTRLAEYELPKLRGMIDLHAGSQKVLPPTDAAYLRFCVMGQATDGGGQASLPLLYRLEAQRQRLLRLTQAFRNHGIRHGMAIIARNLIQRCT